MATDACLTGECRGFRSIDASPFDDVEGEDRKLVVLGFEWMVEANAFGMKVVAVDPFCFAFFQAVDLACWAFCLDPLPIFGVFSAACFLKWDAEAGNPTLEVHFVVGIDCICGI